MLMRASPLLVVLLLLVACGGAPNAGPTTATPTPGVTPPTPERSEAPTEPTPFEGEITTPEPTPTPAPTVDLAAVTLPVVELDARDVANAGDASDIQVTFMVTGTGGIKAVGELWVVLVKAESALERDATALLPLPEDHVAIPAVAEDGFVLLRLPAAQVDSDGDPVVEGRPYVVRVMARVGAALPHVDSSEIVLADETAVWTLVSELPAATGGIELGPDGALYVASIGRAPQRRGKEIYRVTMDGEWSLWFESDDLSGATGNIFDDEGNLFQSSLSNDVVLKISPDGEILETLTEGINGPVGLDFGPDGALYIANCGERNVVRILPSGESELVARGSEFRCPNGITVDDEGNVYFVNFFDGRVVAIDPSGEVDVVADLPGNNNGHLVHIDGLLYVVARGDQRVYTVTPGGRVSVLAGSGERGHADGPALEATFSLPNDIDISPDGRRLFLNESASLRGTENIPSVVRVIELPRQP